MSVRSYFSAGLVQQWAYLLIMIELGTRLEKHCLRAVGQRHTHCVLVPHKLMTRRSRPCAQDFEYADLKSARRYFATRRLNGCGQQVPNSALFSFQFSGSCSTPHLVNFCATPRVWSTDSLTEKEILRKDGEIKPWKVALWLSGLTLAIVCYGVPGTDWRSPGLRCGRSRSCSPGPLSHG